MIFYVNAVHLKGRGYNEQCIGLFDNNEWDGRGTFCGYYGSEFYLNTTLIAYGVQLRSGGMPYNPKAPFDGGFYANVRQHFDEIAIGSQMWEKKIEAANIDEAVDIFMRQDW